jgi:cell pole-organizing protein PopZ
MVSEENNQEMSVNEILSSIKEVISNDKVSKDIVDEEEILELTDVISDEDDSILLDDVVDPDDLPEEPITNEDLADDIRKNLNLDESSFLSDLSIDDIIRETIKETLNEWFANNLKPIVEESVKEEVAKLFKKRN